MTRVARTIGVVLCAISLFPARGTSQNWKDDLKGRITAYVSPADASSDRLRINRAGTVLVVRRDGISASPGKDATYLKNYLRDGQIHTGSGLFVDKKNNRDYRVGERVYVTKVDVNDDNILLFLISLETDQIMRSGNTEQTRFKALLQIDFPKGTLETTDFASVQQLIGSVLEVEGSATVPKTVELGQTEEQVAAVLGAPDTVLRLGNKTVYVYKDFKVTFVDGKVTDVQ